MDVIFCAWKRSDGIGTNFYCCCVFPGLLLAWRRELRVWGVGIEETWRVLEEFVDGLWFVTL